MAIDIEQLKKSAVPVLKEAGVLQSDIFGSAARGETTDESDIDFLVDLPRGTSLFDLADLQIKLEETLGRKVDILTYRSISPLLKDYINRDKIRIL